jgi:hypothetical protein
LYPGISVRSAESFCAEDSSLKDADYILISDTCIDEVPAELFQEHFFIGLYNPTDGSGDIFVDTGCYTYMDKYIGCSGIMKTLRNMCFEYGNDDLKSRLYKMPSRAVIPGTTRIDFCSSRGGVGTSSIAMSVANELALYRSRKVVLLSREAFENSLLYIHESMEVNTDTTYGNIPHEEALNSQQFEGEMDDEDHVSRSVYYFMREHILTGYTSFHTISIPEPVKDLFRFKPRVCRNAVADVSAELFDVFADQIMTETGAEFLIIDRGNTTFNIDPNSHCVYVAGSKEQMAKMPRDIFCQHLGIHATTADNGEANLVIVRNILGTNDSEEAQLPDILDSGCGALDFADISINSSDTDFMRTDQGIAINLNGTFGAGIRRLTDVILKDEA